MTTAGNRLTFGGDCVKVDMSGHFAVYFNKHADAPLVWSICPDPKVGGGRWPAWKLEVCAVVFDGCAVQTRYEKREEPDDETGLPSAYLVVFGSIELRDGVAHIKPVAMTVQVVAGGGIPPAGMTW